MHAHTCVYVHAHAHTHKYKKIIKGKETINVRMGTDGRSSKEDILREPAEGMEREIGRDII